MLTREPELSLGLLAYSTRRGTVTSREAVAQKLPEHIDSGVCKAIESRTVEIIRNPTDQNDVFLIYPALDEHQNVFAILIERSEAECLEDIRLAHSFLRIYSNFLRLLEQNRRDKLTGFLNRETLEEEITKILILNSENIPAGYESEPTIELDNRNHVGDLKYWIGVLDIDHFKSINDSYGHLYGDEILILIARIMEEAVRSYDLVFRSGGEEFVILLKAFDENDARNTFERIRMTVGHHDYAKVEQVTISIGVTQIGSQTMGATDVLEEADSALYYAKENGRDQVQFFAQLVEKGLIEPLNSNVETGGINLF